MKEFLRNMMALGFYIVQAYILFLAYYYIVISLFGLFKEEKEEDMEPQKKFAIGVAAHNEERVVAQIVKNLQELDYPNELYDVFVLCDNCTDKTAEIVRENGGNALERFNDSERGKGYALKWFFDKLYKMEKEYDAVVIFDADNLVSKNFLKKMNNNLINGNKVIQGYLDTKNPDDSWITISYALAYWTMNRMYQLARKRLKLSAAVGGTGFCVSMDVIKEVGWEAVSLTEDLEFTMKCLLKDINVAWEHNVRIYDEKPLTLGASFKQRTRWLQGHWDCAFRYTMPLLIKAIRDKSLACFDGAVYMVQPSRIVLQGIILIFAILKTFFPSLYVTEIVFPKYYWIVSLIFSYGIPLTVLIMEKISFKRMLGLIVYPIFGFTWIPISVIGLLKKNEKNWSHTKHDRTINEEDLKNLIG